MRNKADVVVVGGGVMGTSVAYFLAKNGVRNVVLLEKNYLGSGSTGRCAGLVRSQRKSKEQIILHNASLRLIEHLSQELDFDIMFRQCGYVVLAQTEAREKVLKEQISLQNANGVKSRYLGPEEVKKLIPLLDEEKIVGAAYYEKDGTILPWALVYGFERAAKRLGVEVNAHTLVRSIEASNKGIKSVTTDRGRIDTEIVVNAAGDIGGKGLAEMVGLDLPVYTVRREALVTEPLKPFVDPVVAFHAPLGGYIWQGLRGELFSMTYRPIAQTCKTLDNQDSTLDFLEETARSVTDLFPSLRHICVMRQWAGIRDVSPDGWPILGKVEQVPGFILVNGFSGIGFQIGPIVGKLISELIVSGNPSISLDPFSIDRFKKSVTKTYDHTTFH